ncbi:RDD family protein [Chelatococcus composti]|jgi:uncharacterized RDD family membrane protein YckC|uniref:Putative RDD family membrane protein YckC n=1 Tax=Chelatococcus composti TaxID=1743235 RepID=A0A841KE48_9HYPH|nr:RDD family protein [Chelatococcus composti]MBB6169632.1 putative RDD family membrane protein YckC [Chelatococcus composti]MBS7736839.1 RDD family protein [Chelatococcus composti]PZN41217.1 MAG: RDD family protein [Pseudomonadota bacterium]GGG49539.1 membrane protein [Chelatococcus composti]
MSQTMPTLPPEATAGVLTPRLFAYLIDICVIAVLMVMLFVIVTVLGALTFGLAWFLFPVVGAGTGVLYSMVTVGGSRQSTIGMRMLGLRAVGPGGTPVDYVTAAVHALLFYVAASTGLVLMVDILVGLLRDDRRLLHDVLTGVTIVNAR